MLSDEKLQWLQSTLKINVRHQDVEVPQQEDFLRRARGPEYEDEEKKVGFRAHLTKAVTPEQLELQKERAEGTHRVTQMYTDEEVAQNKVYVSDKGKLEREDGERLSGEMIYSVQAESGEMVTGEENAFRLIDTKTGNVFPSDMRFLDAEKFARNSKGAYRFENLHHSSLAQGGDVRGAGVIKVSHGEINSISNTSGHYKPRFEHLLQVVEGLISSGALLQQDIVDHEGRSAKESHPKAYELYKKLQPRVEALGQDKARIGEIVQQLSGGEVAEEDAKSLGGELDRLTRGADLVTKGLEALRKMGIGASNRLKDVEVTLNYASETSNGAEFVTSKATDKMKLSELVMGQGSKTPELLDPAPLEQPNVVMSQTYLHATFGEDGTIEIEQSQDEVETESRKDDEDITNKYLSSDDGEGHVVYTSDQSPPEEKVEVTAPVDGTATVQTDDDFNKYLTNSDEDDHDNYTEDDNLNLTQPLGNQNENTQDEDRFNKYLSDQTDEDNVYSPEQEQMASEQGSDTENQPLRNLMADNSYTVVSGVKTFDSGRVELAEETTSPLRQNLAENTYTLGEDGKQFGDGHVEANDETPNDQRTKYLHEEEPSDAPVGLNLSPESQNDTNMISQSDSYTIEGEVMTFGDGRVEVVVKTPEQLEKERQAVEKDKQEKAEAILKEARRKAASRQADGKNAMMDELDSFAKDGTVPLPKDGIRDPGPIDAPYQGEDLTDDVKGTVNDQGEEVAAKLLKTREQEEQYLERLRQERLAEAKSAGEEIRKGLRPEDRVGGKERVVEGKFGEVKDTTVSEGQAPELDHAKWDKEVGKLNRDLDNLNREDDRAR